MRIPKTHFLLLSSFLAAIIGCRHDSKEQQLETPAPSAVPSTAGPKKRVVRSDDEWQKLLTPEQFAVCRKKGTDTAFTGKFWNNHEAGIYRCVACGTPLFGSITQFDSGTGWPSFTAAIDARNVRLAADTSYGALRTEVVCAVCDSHLGHVFDDGPAPTGKRYCINSVCLEFKPG